MADFFMSLLAVTVLLLIVLPLCWYIFRSISSNLELSDEAEHCHWANDHWQTDGSLKLKALEHRVETLTIPAELRNFSLEEFLSKQLQRSPISGDSVQAFGLRFDVMTRSKGVVDQVLVYEDERQKGIRFNLPD